MPRPHYADGWIAHSIQVREFRVLFSDDAGGAAVPEAVTRLFELGIVEMGGKPQLTAYGENCFVVVESRDEEVPELDPNDQRNSGSCE